MKKRLLLFLYTLFIVLNTHAQSRVFKQVGSGISTSLHSIVQDGSLVGYLTFTELEKASKDSFNYAITIMDENLNDIGKVKFRQQKLILRDVAFEQDILCLAYIKSDVLDITPKHRISYKQAAKKGYVSFFAQFINLQGEITKTFEKKADVDIYVALKEYDAGIRPFKEDIQLKNIANVGFAAFYGDKSKKPLLTFNAAGEKISERQVKEVAASYYLHTAGDDIYLLTQKADMEARSGYTLFGYSGTANSPTLKLPLKDKKQRMLDILGFGNDPVTGKLFISGTVGSKTWNNGMNNVYGLYNGEIQGIYKMDINAAHKEDVKTMYSCWADSTGKDISKKGYINSAHGHIVPRPSFRDFDGNTYFLGSRLTAKKNKGAIIAGLVMSPLLIPYYVMQATGAFGSYSFDDVLLMQMDKSGKISYVDSIGTDLYKQKNSAPIFKSDDNCSFYSLTNPDTKTSFLIVKGEKDITIYNVHDKKIVRKIAKNNNTVKTNIYPAKDGHIIVSEYDEKEKSTRLSIEAI
ncbi:hypothetical protein SAMN05428949_7306 [Chitinophaga sp. YR627]|uniref:DUF6770 family protein n=1 Tax=Chitinophaga sp. YR627 TaxID=1881041 RepID=UPI0008EEB1B2|nr:DUF6770 family protein [Chitinophaga sp. YR627]SFP08123.1 hypothetical protein SAMN05428949_7306 [Chitinophaga sp. YR627]